MINTTLFGDAREKLQEIAGSCYSPRMCITSPPYYGLRDYNQLEEQIGPESSPIAGIPNFLETNSALISAFS